MKTQLRKTEVAWAIFHQLISRSDETLIPVMTHPCGEQYECLTVLKDDDKKGLYPVTDINLHGTHIRVRSDILLEFDESMSEHQIEMLVERIIANLGLRLRNKPRFLPGMEFIRELLKANKRYELSIANAWYDGSYSCFLTDEAKTFPFYPVRYEQNWLEHAVWWTISLHGDYRQKVPAICNIQTHEVITMDGKKFKLDSEMKEALATMNALIKNNHRTPREISGKFRDDLYSGKLYPILNHVHRDNNLTIEIRSGYINIYYRGGNMLRIHKKKTGYSFEFDLRYIKVDNTVKAKISNLPKHVDTPDHVREWADMVPAIKAEMDAYFVSHKKAEREFQQLVVRENNLGGIAKKTDYYICDIEYQVGDTRLDLVAAKCTGRGNYRLALIEMKYADSALGGKSGIVDHVRKAYAYLLANNIDELKKEMHGILETKRTLGLVDDLPAQFAFTDERPEFIFLLANHKPASSLLDTELNKLEKESFYADFCKMADLKFATASFFGYGLFNDCIYTQDEFKEVNQALLDIADRRKK